MVSRLSLGAVSFDAIVYRNKKLRDHASTLSVEFLSKTKERMYEKYCSTRLATGKRLSTSFRVIGIGANRSTLVACIAYEAGYATFYEQSANRRYKQHQKFIRGSHDYDHAATSEVVCQCTKFEVSSFSRFVCDQNFRMGHVS